MLTFQHGVEVGFAFVHNRFNLQILSTAEASIYSLLWNFCFKVIGMCWFLQRAGKADLAKICNFSQTWDDSAGGKVMTKNSTETRQFEAGVDILFFLRLACKSKAMLPKFQSEASADASTGGVCIKFGKGQLWLACHHPGSGCVFLKFQFWSQDFMWKILSFVKSWGPRALEMTWKCEPQRLKKPHKKSRKNHCLFSSFKWCV